MPKTAATHISLVFWTYPWRGTAAALLAEGAARFAQAVRGVRLQTMPGNPDAGQVASAILAGTGPDVVWGTDYARLVEVGALLRLDDLVAGDPVDFGQWPAGKVAMLRTAEGMFGLPAYTAAMCYLVRLQDWDDRHAEPPAPDWSYQDFAAEAQRMSLDAGGRHRFGACLQWYSTGIGDNAWAFRGFGGGQVGPDGASSTLGTPEAVAAGRWIYSLLWARQACTADQAWQGADLATDGVAMMVSGPWTVAGDAANYGTAGFRWDYYPFPTFPHGRATYANTDFFAASARTRHPEAAWALLKWVATDPEWQRWVMRVGLLPPGSASLWDEWEAQVRAVAPPLQDKALHWFSDAARAGYAYPQAYYRYRSAEAQAIADSYVSKLWNRQIPDVQSAFIAADQAINAFLNEAATQAAGASAGAQTLVGSLAAAAKGTGTVALPEPPDAEQPPAETAGLLALGPAGFVLSGNGVGLDGTSDAGAFAGSVARAASAEFTCRLTVLRNVDCPYVDERAVVALMARASLAADAPCVGVGVTGGRGIQVSLRPAAGLPAQVWSGADGPGGGLLSAGAVTRDGRRPAPNYLLQPLWLKLRRAGSTWTCLVSRDGHRWLQAGPALTLPIAGCWVGVFASAHNGSPGFRAGQTIQADFPDCDPAPERAVQLGVP